MHFFKILPLLLLLLLSCSQPNNKSENDDFSSLYKPLIQHLKENDLKLIKYVSKGELRDTIAISSDSVNWEEELKLFLDIKISKSVYIDYEITSNNENCKKQFLTSSNKHAVKNYQYDNCNGNLVVNIDVKKSSPLYEFDYHLEINEDGFLIETKSDVELAYNSSFRVEGKFIKEN